MISGFSPLIGLLASAAGGPGEGPGYSTSAGNPTAVIDVSDEKGQYINSFCITRRGTWLISVTNMDINGTYTRRSLDRGRTWEERVLVYSPPDLRAGEGIEMGQLIALPLPVAGRERIYQFHVKKGGESYRFGRLVYTVSHDDGRTWEGPSGPDSVYEAATPAYALAPNGDGWHLMAPGLRLDTGEWLLPLNVSTDPKPLCEIRSEPVFAISGNIERAEDPAEARFEFFPPPPHGVQVPLESAPSEYLGQEPQAVQLDDGRLFSVMRTGNGCLFYSVSEDLGRSWRRAEPLRYRDGGDRLLHPNAPCPLAKIPGGRYALLFCNNDGTAFGGRDPFDHLRNRQPVFVTVGRETGSRSGQPLRFSEPRPLCDIEGFMPDMGWRDLTYGFFIEDRGEYYHFYNAVWRAIQVNRVDPALVTWNGR